jgi:hypothetical protein
MGYKSNWSVRLFEVSKAERMCEFVGWVENVYPVAPLDKALRIISTMDSMFSLSVLSLACSCERWLTPMNVLSPMRSVLMVVHP